jgi:shikimate 5-dehydrogenase
MSPSHTVPDATADDSTTPVASTLAHKPSVAVITKFLQGHGGSGKAVIAPVTDERVRIVVVADDGIIGDQIVSSLDIAEATVAAVDQLQRADGWERDIVAQADLEPGHAQKMAGWVAHQKRFATARTV